MDGITLYIALREINNMLEGAILRKVYEMEDGLFILQFYKGYEYNLLVKYQGSASRIHLCGKKRGNALPPSSFCMLMRKYIQGKRLVHIESFNTDKKGILSFSDGQKSWKLHILLHNRESNIILTDGNQHILGSIRTLPAKNISANKEYLPSPLPTHKTDILAFSSRDLLEGKEEDIHQKLLHTFTGLSKNHIELILSEKKATFYEKLLNFIKRIKDNNIKPFITDGENIDKHFYLWPPEESIQGEFYSSVNDMLCNFYEKVSEEDAFTDRKEKICKRLKQDLIKAQKRLSSIEEDLAKLKSAEKLKTYGELLLTELHLVPAGASSFKTTDYSSENFDEIIIPLNPALSPSDNAKKYFEKYKKSKRGLPVLENRLNETALLIKLLEDSIQDAQAAMTPEALDLCCEKFNWQSKTTTEKTGAESAPRRFIFKNYEILSGKNPLQNDELSLKTASKNDLWFHTRGIPGSHVIIRTKQGEKTPSEVIVRAASIAAWYSKGKNSSKVPVSYTIAKNVSKKKGMPPGMVSVSGETTIMVDPLNYDFQEWLKANTC